MGVRCWCVGLGRSDSLDSPSGSFLALLGAKRAAHWRPLSVITDETLSTLFRVGRLVMCFRRLCKRRTP
eukprot:3354495-Amphidinium_carterae.1